MVGWTLKFGSWFYETLELLPFGTGGRCLLTSFKGSKMNQVADQRVFCLVLIIFTKYFWFSAFQDYSSGIYIYWHLLTLTVLLHACVLIHFSRVQLFATLWTVAHQTPLCPWGSLHWVATLSSKGSSWPRDWTLISYVFCIGRHVIYH